MLEICAQPMSRNCEPTRSESSLLYDWKVCSNSMFCGGSYNKYVAYRSLVMEKSICLMFWTWRDKLVLGFCQLGVFELVGVDLLYATQQTMAKSNEMDKVSFTTNWLVARQTLMNIPYLEEIHKFCWRKVKRVHRWRLSFEKHWSLVSFLSPQRGMLLQTFQQIDERKWSN